MVRIHPSCESPSAWFPERPSDTEWRKIRKKVLTRDDHTCCGCGHRHENYMNVHHIDGSSTNDLHNLVTLCVACHAVLHMGHSLRCKSIEIWKSTIPQIDIIRRTRSGISSGHCLAEINDTFDLSKGNYDPDSLDWANSIIDRSNTAPRFYLPEGHVAVFVNLTRWQI